MKRIKTHISGFDKLISGGFPENSSVLVSGAPGTGKTIFSLQYLYNGAIKDDGVSIYFTFEEKKESLFEQAAQFNFDFSKLEKENKLQVISIGSEDISLTTVDYIEEIIIRSKAKRVVIDSLSTLAYLTPENGFINKFTIKKFLYNFITRINRKTNTQILYVSQKEEIISDLISRYLCDGVIDIEYNTMGGNYSRVLSIKKMRKTFNDDDIHPFQIKSNEGILIHDLE
jgi:KaiC/GvpD/RAD55 family RecA-like ATPase